MKHSVPSSSLPARAARLRTQAAIGAPAALAALALAALLPACTVIEPAPVAVSPEPITSTEPVAELEPPPVISVYEEPLLVQPEPILVPWAPPPMLVQVPPPAPFADAYWVGGYWGWHGRWVWSAGYWARPPRPGYVWIEPYYEHRGNAVVYVSGYWGAPGVAFVPPPPSLRLSLAITVAGASGVAPVGPQGVFVPPPPGSRPGLIVPAPIGTPPAVVTGAPAVVHEGMRIVHSNNVTINRNTTINNVTNVRKVTVVAPAAATADRRAFQADVPARPALAAAEPARVRWQAPLPQRKERLRPMAEAGRPAAALPPAQPVHVAPAPMRMQREAMPEAREPHPAAARPGGLPAPAAGEPRGAMPPARREAPMQPGGIDAPSAADSAAMHLRALPRETEEPRGPTFRSGSSIDGQERAATHEPRTQALDVVPRERAPMPETRERARPPAQGEVRRAAPPHPQAQIRRAPPPRAPRPERREREE